MIEFARDNTLDLMERPAEALLVENGCPNSADEARLEDQPVEALEALHEVFHTEKYIPCRCGSEKAVHLTLDYTCALRLSATQQITGDKTPIFYDSIITEDSARLCWSLF